MYRLITLDATNTLFRVQGSVGLQYSKAALRFGHKLDPEITESEFKKAFKIQNNKHPNFGVADGMSTREWWHKVVRKTVEFSIPSLKIEGLSSYLYDEFSKGSSWEPFPEVHHVLSQLRKRNCTLGVVSNFDERLGTILEELKLKELFSFVVCSAEVNACKPSPAIFEIALQLGEVESSEALHVGDSMVLDFEAAKSFGLSALLLQRQQDITNDFNGNLREDHVIQDLRPLLDL